MTNRVQIEFENGGIIQLELSPDVAPQSVANFQKLVSEHFYDGLIFHRVIAGFMIQGGGFDADLDRKEADAIYGEFASNGFAQNTLKHTRGVLSMARTNVPDSASSQFFIIHEDSPHLDGDYAAFGKVTAGMETVDWVAAQATDGSDMPLENIVMKEVRFIAE